MKIMLHHTLLFLTFWYLSINYTDSMTSLYPHTLQQMEPTEKMTTDMILTSTIAMLWTTINNIITKQLSNKSSDSMLTHTMMMPISMKTMYMTLTPTLKMLNTHYNNNNLNTALSMKKFYLTAMTMNLLLTTLLLMLMKSKHYNLNRIFYFPLITLTSMLTPSEPLLMMMIMTMTMMPMEMSTMMKNMNENYKSS